MSQNDYIKYKTLILKLLNDSPILIPYSDYTSYNVYYLVSSIQNTKEPYNNLLPPNVISIFNIQQPFIPSSSTISLSPYGLTVIRNTYSSITITFVPPTSDRIDAYTVTAIPDDGETVVQIFPGYYDTYTINNLQGSTVYTISIIATISTVNSNPSNIILYSTSLSPPTALTISNITDSTLDISFNPPTGSITSYEVTAKSISGNVGPQIFYSSATTYRLTDLSSNVSYTISIISKNSQAASLPFETSLSYRTLLLSPKSLTGSSISGSSILISYTAPTIGTSYTYNITTTPPGTDEIQQNITATTYNITGLQSNFSYTISVVANAANGNYSVPAILNYRTLLPPPTNFTYTGRTSTTISVSFTEPMGEIDTYRITASSINGSINPQSFNAPATTYTITGLLPGLLYTINIFAIIDGIISAASTSIEYSTILLPPENVSSIRITNSSISISFTESEGNVNKYKIVAKPKEGDTVFKEFPQILYEYEIDQLQSGMEYEIWVIAMNNIPIESVKSESIVITTILSPPTNLSVDTIIHSSARVSFTAPSSGSITNYKVTATPQYGQPVIKDISGNSTSTTIDLDPNTYYTISVVAFTTYASSIPLGSTTSYRTLLLPPSNLIVTGRNENTIDILFNPPNDGITTYTYNVFYISRTPDSSGNITITQTNHRIDNLTSGVFYTIYVNTKNAEGNNYSLPISTTNTTLLLPPSGLMPITSTESSIDISFAETSGYAVGYEITADPASTVEGGAVITPFSSYQPPYAITGLQSGMKYTISATAKNTNTISVKTEDISYNTLLPKPRDLSVNTITDQTIDVSFNRPSNGNVSNYSVTASPVAGQAITIDNIIDSSTRIPGLAAGMQYGISAVAYTSYTNSKPLLSDLSYVTLLPPPSDLYINTNTITNTSIDISFNAPSSLDISNITKYIVTATPDIGQVTIKDNIIVKSITIDELLSGMKYGLRVVANTLYTNSLPLISDASYITLLPKPRDLYINTNTITKSTIDISFNPPSIVNIPNISTYTLVANAADGSSTSNTIASTSTTIDELLSGMQYGISVVANTLYTNSLPLLSDLSYVTVLPPPRDLSVNTITITKSTIDISFNVPSITNTIDITKYTITATPAVGQVTIKDNIIDSSTTIDELLSGMQYGINVVANTLYTNSLPLISDASYITLLPKPRDLSVNTITDQTIDVSFNPPSIVNTINIDKYMVTANPATGQARTIDNIRDSSTRIPGLAAGMQYGISAVAYTSYTNSLPLLSDLSYVTLLPPPRNLSVNTITDTTIDISFNEPSSLDITNINNYSVVANAADGSSTSNTIPSTSTTLGNLKSGMKYGLSVVANTPYKSSDTLISDASYVTVLLSPRDLSVNTITDQSINISFNAPSITNVETISTYSVVANAADGSSTSNNITSTSTTLGNLKSGMKYGISVVANTPYKSSLPLLSDVSYVTLLLSPRDLSVNTITDESIDVSFNAPSIVNLTDITKYTITATPAMGQPTIKEINELSTTIDELLSGMQYRISVVANTLYKTSDPLISDESYNTLLPPPRNLSVNISTITDESIDVSFNAPLSGSVTKYTITAKPIIGSQTIKEINGLSTTINGLLAGMSYTIIVFATNSYTVSSSLLSDTSYNTLLPPPSSLSVTNITDTSMNVAFTSPARGEVTKYTIIASPDTGNDVSFNFNTFQSLYEINGLSNNTSYIIRVVASTNYTSSLELTSGTTKYITLLPPPTNVSVSIATITDTSMNISFTASPNPTVNAYEVTALSTSGNVGPQSFTGTTYTVVGLTRDTSYNISVVAKNPDNNRSLASVSGLTYRTLLPQPRNLLTTGPTNTSIDISFNLPNDLVTPPYTYDISYSPTFLGSSVYQNSITNYIINALQSGVFYTIYVNTKNIAGNYSLPVSTTDTTILLPPTGLQAISSTKSSIDISFAETSGYLVGYEITADPASTIEGATVITPFSSYQPPYTITGLQSGMKYTISVKATNTNTTSVKSADISFNTVLPSPTGIQIRNVSDRIIDISFNAPSSGSVTKYNVSAQSTESGTTITVEPTQTYATLTGLEPGKSYTIRVKAINSYVESLPAIINGYKTILTSPRNLIVPLNTITYESITISFDAPSSGTLYTYEVTALSDNGNVGPQSFVDTNHRITDLSSNTSYTISIVAKTVDNNTSLPLESATSYRTLLPPPSNLIVTGITNTSIDISFNVPNDGITTYSYDISYSPTFPGSSVYPISTTNYTINELQSGVFYTIYVNTKNTTGNYSLPISTTDTTLLLPPSGLQAISSTELSIDISFAETSGYLVEYEITAIPSSTVEGGTVVKTFSSYQPSYQIMDLQSGMQYTISAKAKNTNITSVKSEDILYNTILPQPRNLSVNTITDSTTSVSFNKPSSGSITQYTISATHGSSSMVKENIIVTDSQQSLYSTTIIDLSAGMSYVVSVTAFNNYTQSVSLTSNLFYTVLPPPRDLSVNNITETTLDISFNAPSRGLITKYRAFTTDATEAIVTKDNIIETFATITNLIPGMTYNISVIAFSIDTQSSPLISGVSYNTILPAPRDLSVNNITDTSMNVAFTAPVQGVVTKYTITAKPDTGNDVSFNFYTFQSLYEINGLTSNTSYTISVVASTNYTSSLPLSSGTTKYKTLLSPPRNLIVNTNTITDTSMNIEFTASTNTTVNEYEVIALSASGNVGPQSFTGTTYTVVGLTRDTSYNISVVAKNPDNNISLPLISATSYRTLLPQPRNLLTTGRTNTSIDISFDAPNDVVTTYTYNVFYVSTTPDSSGNIPITQTNYIIDNLLSGVFYTIYVNTKNAAGNYSLPVSTSNITLLSPPTNIKVTVGFTTIDVSFNLTIGEVDKYEITADPTEGIDVSQNFLQPFNPPYVVSGLQSGMSYSVYVRAMNSIIISNTSDYTNVITKLPPPTSLLVTDISYTSISISFTAPPNATISYYVVTFTSLMGSVIEISPIYIPSTTKTSLQEGMAYTIKVVARTSYTSSDLLLSDISYVTLLPPPTGLIVNTFTATSMNVSFTAPYSGIPFTGAIINYKITATPSSGQSVIKDAGNSTTSIIGGLISGMSYTVTVIASTAYKNSNALETPPETVYKTLLPAPSALVITGITDASMNVAFNAPSSGTVTKYTITATPSSGPLVILDVSGTVLSTPITGLLAGMSYTVTVVAINDYTTSLALAPGTIYYTILPPPTTLVITGITDASMNVSFTAPSSGTVIKYTITATPSSGPLVILDVSGTVLSTPITGLQAGMSYTVSVVASNIYTVSAALAPGTIYKTILPPPTSLLVSNITDASMDIAFTAPSRGTVTTYTIKATAADLSYVTKDISGNVTSTTIGVLLAGMLYTITVVASNIYATSAALAPGTSYYTILPPPTGLKQNGNAATTIDISFNPPVRGTITKYTVNAINSGIIISQIFTPPFTIYRITGLQSGTIYDISMNASTAYANSVYTSNITYSTTISPPTNLIASNVTGSSMKISFTPPAGTVTQYTLSVTPTPSGGFTGIVPGTDTSYNLTGLSSYITYTISMTATNGVVTSVASTSITPSTSLSPPTGLTATGFTSNSITIAFNLVSGADTYKVDAVPYSGNTVNTPAFTSSPYTIQGLHPGMSYDISIYATKSGVNSASSTPISYNTQLITPTNIASPIQTATTITITFDSASDRIVDSYGIKVAEFNSGLPTYYSAKQASYTITGLTVYSFYSIIVFAKNANGVSDDSNIFNQFTRLAAPTSIVATLNNTTINMTFVKSGITIMYGKVIARPTSGDTVIQRFFQPGTNFNIMGYITPQYYNDLLYWYEVYTYNNLINERSANEPCGLQPNTTYTITMIMGNNSGDSAESTSAQITTPSLLPPTNLSVTSSTPNKINISFTATTSTIDTYVVTASPFGGGTVVRQLIDKAATIGTIINLIINTTYTISLFAISGSIMSSVTTTGGTPNTQIYTNVTYPDAYTKFILTSNWATTDTYSNTILSKTISAGPTHTQGTYTVSSSSAYAGYAHPYIAFRDTHGSGDPWFSTGGNINTDAFNRTLTYLGPKTYLQNGYNPVYIGGGRPDVTFSTSYTKNATLLSISGEWIQVQFPYSIKLTNMTFYPRIGVSIQSPTIGYILGSNDGSTWDHIYDYSVATINDTVNSFTISTTNYYNYIRFVMNRTLGSTNYATIGRMYYTGDILF